MSSAIERLSSTAATRTVSDVPAPTTDKEYLAMFDVGGGHQGLVMII